MKRPEFDRAGSAAVVVVTALSVVLLLSIALVVQRRRSFARPAEEKETGEEAFSLDDPQQQQLQGDEPARADQGGGPASADILVGGGRSLVFGSQRRLSSGASALVRATKARGRARGDLAAQVNAGRSFDIYELQPGRGPAGAPVHSFSADGNSAHSGAVVVNSVIDGESPPGWGTPALPGVHVQSHAGFGWTHLPWGDGTNWLRGPTFQQSRTGGPKVEFNDGSVTADSVRSGVKFCIGKVCANSRDIENAKKAVQVYNNALNTANAAIARADEADGLVARVRTMHGSLWPGSPWAAPSAQHHSGGSGGGGVTEIVFRNTYFNADPNRKHMFGRFKYNAGSKSASVSNNDGASWVSATYDSRTGFIDVRAAWGVTGTLNMNNKISWSNNSTWLTSLAAPAPARKGSSSRAEAARAPAKVVLLFEHCNYQGWKCSIAPGRHTLSSLKKLGFKDKGLSSIQVSGNATVTLYDQDNFGGKSTTLKQSTGCLVSAGWNDRATSIIVS